MYILQTVTEVGVKVVFPRGVLYCQVGATVAEDGRRCSFSDFTFVRILQHDRHCRYNVTVGRVCLTIVAEEKH